MKTNEIYDKCLQSSKVLDLCYETYINANTYIKWHLFSCTKAAAIVENRCVRAHLKIKKKKLFQHERRIGSN